MQPLREGTCELDDGRTLRWDALLTDPDATFDHFATQVLSDTDRAVFDRDPAYRAGEHASPSISAPRRLLQHECKDGYHAIMIRTQVSLTEEQLRGLRRVAARRSQSLAGVVRDAVDGLLEREGLEQAHERVFRSVGRYGSGRPDVARDHDRHLAEAFDHRSPRG